MVNSTSVDYGFSFLILSLTYFLFQVVTLIEVMKQFLDFLNKKVKLYFLMAMEVLIRCWNVFLDNCEVLKRDD